MLYLLPSPLGNLSDTTFRVLEVLQRCEVLLCEDTRVTQKLISLFVQKGWLHDRERKFLSFHTHNQVEFLSQIDSNFFNQDICFMSDAGMPCVSDPGSELVKYVQRHHIAYEVLPAGSASVLAYAYSGFGDGGFIFDGFLPHKSGERIERLGFWRGILGHKGGTLVVFESPYRILQSIEDLEKVDRECEVFLIKEMTKIHQKFFKGNVIEGKKWLCESNTQGEWCIVIKFCARIEENKLGSVEIMQMDIPPKIKAKLLSKITGLKVEEHYQKLIGARK